MPLPDSAAFLTTDVAAETKLRIQSAETAAGLSTFAAEVITGLTKQGLKEISSSWLYDELGSKLFEAITLLPEYGLTRADERAIARCARSVARSMGADTFVAELGSGTGKKTGVILDEFLPLGTLDYAPIDVSPSALEDCIRQVGAKSGLSVHPTVGSYLDGLRLALKRRRPEQRTLLLFLGSTIGNFLRSEARTFLREIREQLRPGDCMLMGADLEKEPRLLELAYDDPMGVTAAFNKNLLAHLNAAYDGDFDLTRFRHLAIYNRADRRIEMYLESLERQEVVLLDLDLRVSFEAGERLRTELSHKFNITELRRLAVDAGFDPQQEWVDREWPFAESLWRAA